MLSRPLANDVRRPLTAAVAWSWAATIAAVALAGVVAGGGALVSLVQSLAGDADFAFPTALLRTLAWVAVPSVVVVSSWAAAYASAQRHRRRIVPAVTVAAIVGALALVSPVAGAVAGLGTAWAVAVPFEAWSRLLLRLAGTGLIAAVTSVVDLPAAWWIVAVAIATAGPLLAAVGVLAGDAAWRLRRRS